MYCKSSVLYYFAHYKIINKLFRYLIIPTSFFPPFFFSSLFSLLFLNRKQNFGSILVHLNCKEKYSDIKNFLNFFVSIGLKHGNSGVGSASSSRSTSPSQQQPSQGALSFIPQPRTQNANRQPTATTPR